MARGYGKYPLLPRPMLTREMPETSSIQAPPGRPPANPQENGPFVDHGPHMVHAQVPGSETHRTSALAPTSAPLVEGTKDPAFRRPDVLPSEGNPATDAKKASAEGTPSQGEHSVGAKMIATKVAEKASPWAEKRLLSPPRKYLGWWSPTNILSPEDLNPSYFLVMVNQAIPRAHESMFERLWHRAVYRICADGAANRLFDALSSRGFRDFAEAGPVPMSPSEKGQFVPPNEIVGDLDSLRPEVRQFFEQRGTQIVQRPSQYATDLQKSIQRAEDMEEESGGWLRGDLLIYGGLSGRFDQTCHTLHVLWQLAEGVETPKGVDDPDSAERGGKVRKRNRAWVVNDDSVTWLLPAGEHDLQMSQRVMGKTCGVLPLGIGVQNGGARVVTNGLRWNLNADTGTHLGGLLSTSNHMANEDGIVKLQTDQPVYWTVELKSDAEIASAKRNL